MPASRLRRPRPRRLAAGLAVAAAVSAVAGPALAAFDAPAAAQSHTISSGTLAAPTELTAVRGTCQILSSTRVDLSWTATSSTFADGYEIFRSTTDGGPYGSIATVSPWTTTTYVDTTVAFSMTYYYLVQATRNAWRSPDSNQASVTTPGPLCV